MSKMRFFALQELSNRKPLEVTAPSNKLSDYYGSHVFDRKKMQEYLPKEAYKAVIDAIEKGTPINREIADLIANGMKSWAKSLNVTHYTHWFQPLTALSSSVKTVKSSNASPANCLSSRNRMLLLFPTVASAILSKLAAIRHGMFLLRHSL